MEPGNRGQKLVDNLDEKQNEESKCMGLCGKAGLFVLMEANSENEGQLATLSC